MAPTCRSRNFLSVKLYFCWKGRCGATSIVHSSAWSGTVAFPVDLESFEWTNTPWRLEPDADSLPQGDSCMVGIPSSPVLVRAVRRFERPWDLGWLPRPTVGLS